MFVLFASHLAEFVEPEAVELGWRLILGWVISGKKVVEREVV
jgi:hypothetical protein